MKGLPYKIISSQVGTQVRLFKFDSDDEELKWHRDREFRIVKLLSGEGWSVQLDNELPQLILPDRLYEIPAGVWHRVIKGKTPSDLLVEVQMFM